MSQELTQQQQHLVNHLKKPIQALKPPPRLSVSEWADQKRRLDSQTSSEPGKWHTSRAEYQRGIMDACSDPEIREVVVMAGAQLGKSEAILNIIGYHIENDPSPILVLQPTVEMAQSFSKDRVANGLIRSTPCLREKVKDPRARDSGNTTLHKVFPGGALTLVGANSPAGLASRPIRLVLCDEVDRYPTSAGSEGDPIQLARKRANTFWNRKIVMVSTPTNKGASRIEEAFEESDQRRYYVPCKHCHHEQKMIWQNVRWQEGDPDSAAYACNACGVLWTDSDRRWSIRNGRWVAEAEFKGIAGFYINGLYSPWTPLADGVRDFLSMKKNPEQLRVWTNTYLGESWEDAGEQVDDFSLYERREDFEEAVPEEVVFITAGVDVQDNRLEASIIGWARDQESYVIDHKVLYGDPSTPQLWTQLDSLVNKTYETYDGRQMAIRATCIDSGGHFTNSVYQYAKKNAGKRIFAIKGVGGEGKPIAGRPTKNNVARCPLFPIGVDTVKDLLFARMRIEEPGAGYIHFNSHLDDEYFRQLTAEKIVTRFHRGFKKRVFQKVRARNEALDCFVYAIGAYAILNIDVNTLADKVKIKDNVGENISNESKAKPKKPPFVPRVGSGFVNSWR
jgi:phage terminase large subunit GpA-like protein